MVTRDDMYDRWRTVWVEQHPGRTPPTRDEWVSIMKMFGLTCAELGLDAHRPDRSNQP